MRCAPHTATDINGVADGLLQGMQAPVSSGDRQNVALLSTSARAGVVLNVLFAWQVQAVSGQRGQ